MTVTSGTNPLFFGLMGVEVPDPPVRGVPLPVGVRVSIAGATGALGRRCVYPKLFYLFSKSRIGYDSRRAGYHRTAMKQRSQGAEVYRARKQ